MPTANSADVITPIAASAPMVRFREMPLIMIAATTPIANAPTRGLTLRAIAMAAPPNTAWDSPWPM